MTVDITPFCDVGVGGREWMLRPFSIGDFTYATNGHILARVPRRPDVADLEPLPFKISIDTVLGDWEHANFGRLRLQLPRAPETFGRCSKCAGIGSFDWGDEWRDCEACGGYGTQDVDLRFSTMIAGFHFNLSYIRRIVALPDVTFALTASTADAVTFKPMLFRFSEGVGAIIPMRQASTHSVVIER
jgi:hypothetical protein